jgi:hypothetical protein
MQVKRDVLQIVLQDAIVATETAVSTLMSVIGNLQLTNQLKSIIFIIKYHYISLNYFFRLYVNNYIGFDDMITIFLDFSLFSAEKMAFFSKTNVMIIFFLQKLTVV